VAHKNIHRLSLLLVLCLSAPLFGGCAALESEMVSARTAYTQARYEQANVWLDDLEDDQGDMDPAMRADFLYLRGMTAFRLGHRTEALHALAVAREVDEQGQGLLEESERETMTNALAELVPNTATFRAREEGEEAAPVSAAGESGDEEAPPAESSSGSANPFH